MRDEAAAAAGALIYKGTPVAVGSASILGMDVPDPVRALTILWLALLIAGWTWDRFFETWAGPHLRAWVRRWAMWMLRCVGRE
jgi:hypothetical protein